MSNDDLQEVWVLLENSAPSSSLLNYQEYQQVVLLVRNEKARKFFTLNLFAKLSNGSSVVNIANLFNYIARKTWFSRTKVELMMHDISEGGYLTEMVRYWSLININQLHFQELENYFRDLIPKISQLNMIELPFHAFYTCVVVRKFMFFLDPHRSGKVKINDILESSFLDDLVELRSDDLREGREDTNWFSVSNYQKLYDQYVNMDVDQNGMLSLEEMKA